MSVKRDAVYVPSKDIVVREIEGELIIVPLVSGMGDLEDELFSLNDTAREIWRRLDGKHTIDEVVADLSAEYGADSSEIDADVVGLVEELVNRRMLVEGTTD